jgi:hypothetical protein
VPDSFTEIGAKWRAGILCSLIILCLAMGLSIDGEEIHDLARPMLQLISVFCRAELRHEDSQEIGKEVERIPRPQAQDWRRHQNVRPGEAMKEIAGNSRHYETRGQTKNGNTPNR